MILVFGKTGQVAVELQRLENVTALGREDVDLSNPHACAYAIRHHSPGAVINAAAYTAVDKAEEEEELASVINGEAPIAMAEVCAELNIPLIYLSTDYVFEGTGKEAWNSKDLTAPQNAYGRSKLLGEIGVSTNASVYAILRTSWVVSAHGTNFVKAMLRLSETRNSLSVVGDQIGAPTPAKDIAVACLEITKQLIIDPSKSGTYHFSGFPNVSWKEFAVEIFKLADKIVTVNSITTAQYPTPALRPLNSRMNCISTEQTFGLKRPSWKRGLKKILKELKANE
jgi:dTDP-4-dehydrorhamnose reductase